MIKISIRLKYAFSFSLGIIFCLLIKEQPTDIHKVNINSKYENKKLDKQSNEKFDLLTKIVKIYSNLYDYARNGYTKPKFTDIINNYSFNQKKRTICICSIGKNENLYAREFVEYYLNLGVDKLIIYDNNDINGENFESVLNTYYN